MQLLLACGERKRVGGAGSEQQGSCGGEGGRGCCRGLQRRGSALVCSVDSNAGIDAVWRLERPDLGLNLGFDHVDHETQTH